MITILPQLELMTFDGWKYPDQLSENDKIAVLVNNKVLEYKKIHNVNQKKCRDKIIAIQNKDVNIRFEKSRPYLHKRITTNEYKIIKYNTANPYIFGMINKIPKISKLLFDRNNEHRYSHENHTYNNWLEFLSIFLECGEIVKLNTTLSMVIKLGSFNNNAIFKAIINMDLDYRCYNNLLIIPSNKTKNKKLFTEYNKYYGSCTTKKIPHVAWYLSNEYSDKLLNNIIDYNNGPIKNPNSMFRKFKQRYYISDDIDMINEISKLALHSGYVSYMSERIQSNNNYRYIVAGTNVLNTNIDTIYYILTIENIFDMNPCISKKDVLVYKDKDIANIYTIELSDRQKHPIYVRNSIYNRPVWI